MFGCYLLTVYLYLRQRKNLIFVYGNFQNVCCPPTVCLLLQTSHFEVRQFSRNFFPNHLVRALRLYKQHKRSCVHLSLAVFDSQMTKKSLILLQVAAGRSTRYGILRLTGEDTCFLSSGEPIN